MSSSRIAAAAVRFVSLCRFRLVATVLAGAVPGLVSGEACAELAASGLARAASDYVQRGYSKSEDGPTVQLHGSVSASPAGALAGLYAGTWLSQVELGAARWELAPHVGWQRHVAPDWQLETTLAGYLYDDRFGDGDPAAHYAEISGAVHYSDWLSLRAGVAIAPYGFGGTAPELELKWRHPVSDILQLSASLGHAWLGDFAGYEVTHYALGISGLLGTRLQADLRWHGALTRADRPTAPAHDFFERLLVDDRIVGSISFSF